MRMKTGQKVTWRDYYGPDINSGSPIETILEVEADDGVEAAEAIAQEEVYNQTPESNTWAIEILSPPELAGIYDIGLDWDPVAHATKREAA